MPIFQYFPILHLAGALSDWARYRLTSIVQHVLKMRAHAVIDGTKDFAGTAITNRAQSGKIVVLGRYIAGAAIRLFTRPRFRLRYSFHSVISTRQSAPPRSSAWAA